MTVGEIKGGFCPVSGPVLFNGLLGLGLASADVHFLTYVKD